MTNLASARSVKSCIIGLLLLAAFMAGTSVQACSVFVATDGKLVFVGNNEDYIVQDARITFTPGVDGKYGRLVFSFDDDNPPLPPHFPQGGMNTAGLFYDATATPYVDAVFASDLPIFPLDKVLDKMLAECATVAEALTLLSRYTLPGVEQGQLVLADRTGDAAIFGVGKDHRPQITRKQANFMVVTNFNVTQPELGNYPCYRHALATELLQKNGAPTIENFRGILSLVHVEGLASTIYSNIYDLTNGEMQLYYFHNFESCVKINLQEELKRGSHSMTISSLFPHKPFSIIVNKELQAYFTKLQRAVAEKK